MDALTTASLAEALGGITAEAVAPLLHRASRAAAIHLKLRKPDFIEQYTALLGGRRENLAVISLYKTVPKGITLNDIKDSLQSATVRGFIRQLAAIHIIGDPGIDSQRAIQDESRRRVYEAFSDYLSEALSVSHVSQPSSGKHHIGRRGLSELSMAVITVIDGYSRKAADILTRQAKDRNYALSWAQAVQAESILKSIERYAAISAGQEFPSFTKRSSWIDSYRTAFSVRHRNIALPDLDRRRSESYEKLYVVPQLRELGEQGSLEGTLSLDQLLGVIDRVVILGDPGAGKSTMSSIIGMRFIENLEYIPFHIIMREIGITNGGFSVVQEIEKQLVNSYQVRVVPDLVEHLLNIGAAALIFDGLDELLDPSVRRKAASIIEVIAERFPLAPVIVTCRRVGYSQSRLDNEFFTEVMIEKFDEFRIREYVTKWFTVAGISTQRVEDRTLGREQSAKVYVNDFMQSSSSIREMTANPLLLSFICVLYLGRKYIPRNRPQLFEQCVDLLLRAWDVSRGVTKEVADDTYERALADVAEHAGSQPGYKVGIPGSALKQIFADHLVRTAGYPPPKARAVAGLMMEHCKNRAWIFCEIGLPNDRDERYAFTHSSFLEYFRARSLTRHISDPSRLADELFGLLREGRSQIIVQTAIHLCEDHSDGGGSICIRALTDKISTLLPRSLELRQLLLLTSSWKHPMRSHLMSRLFFSFAEK